MNTDRDLPKDIELKLMLARSGLGEAHDIRTPIIALLDNLKYSGRCDHYSYEIDDGWVIISLFPGFPMGARRDYGFNLNELITELVPFIEVMES